MTDPFDVFLTTYQPAVGDPNDGAQRVGMALASMGWWLREQDAGRVRLTVIAVRGQQDSFLDELFDTVWSITGHDADKDYGYVEIPQADSQRRRHIVAAGMSTSDLYICADDDATPWRDIVPWSVPDVREPWDAHVRRVFAERPHLKMCSAFPMPSTLKDPMTAPGVEKDSDVWYVSSIGGVRVVRAGLGITDCPPLEPSRGGGYDSTLCEWLSGGPGMHRTQPAVGYFRRWCMLHHGYRSSLVWPGSHALHREDA